jgi:hypothetical protein
MEEAEKRDILGRLQGLKMKGAQLSKNFTYKSSLKEMQIEIGRLEHEEESKRSVQRLRRWLMAFVSGAQFVTNHRLAPSFVRGKLTGFSDYVLSSIEDYDVIFQSIAERYGGVVGIGSTGKPLVDLGLLLLTQLLMFMIMAHKSSKPPSVEENTDLAKQAASEVRQPPAQPRPPAQPQYPPHYTAPPQRRAPSIEFALPPPDVYDLAMPMPDKNEFFGLHNEFIADAPISMEERIEIIPFGEDSSKETFPQRPSESLRVIETPVAQTSRRGKKTKIIADPVLQPQEDNNDEQKEDEITIT